MKRILFGMTAFAALAILVPFHALSQPPRGKGAKDDRKGPPPRFELGHVFPPPLLEELNLTPEQHQELEGIQKELKTKLEKLLTDEQKKKVENFRPRGPGGPGGPGGAGGPGGGPGGPGGAGPKGAAGRPQGDKAGKRPERPSADPESSSIPDRLIPERPVQARLKDLPPDVTRVPVVFSGGHETDRRDGGRPVVLIAAALDVTPEVFRDAFSPVRPVRGGSEPEPAQVRQNKSVLMKALGKYGITNERLDTVSNYYRYVPGRNELWTNTPAVANALVNGGEVIGYEVIRSGSGYSSPPTVSVPNVTGAKAQVELAFGKDFENNGAVSAITVLKD